jgi:HNH endonuclease
MDELKAKLLANIRKEDGPLEDQCWVWTGTRRSNYGVVWWQYQSEGVHRVAYRAFVGDIPPGMWVLHHCDKPLCINPSHIYLGTPQDNSNDMVERGRNLTGEIHPFAVLDDQDVVEVLRMLQEGKSQVKIAEQFWVRPSAVHKIAHGQTRRSVPGPRLEIYTSRHRGVRKKRDRWRGTYWLATLSVNGRQQQLGSFGFESDAAICWNTHVAYLGLDRPLNEITEWNHD